MHSIDPYLANDNPSLNSYSQPVLRQFQFFPLVPVQPKGLSPFAYNHQQPYPNYNPMLYQQQLMFNQHYLNAQNPANDFRNFLNQQTVTYHPIAEEKDYFKGKFCI